MKETLTNPNNNEKPMTLEEAAKYLNCSPSTLYKLTSTRKILHYKPNGKKIYFDQADLDAYIFQNPIKTVDELDEEVNDIMFANQKKKVAPMRKVAKKKIVPIKNKKENN
ncbi:MAG: helix-turn-helix domain-containing protein [Ignavibacteriales bacterium]|nr:helix-turn-helix domain-containing protein [Ignavibacteriales bacterium]